MTAYTGKDTKNKEDSAQSCKIGAKFCLPCIVSKVLIAGALILLAIKVLMSHH